MMPTASLIKLPVMIEAYRQAEEGKLSLDELLELRKEDQVPGSGILTDHFSPGLRVSLRDAIRLMIRYSDNTATDLVADRIGLASTAQTMAKLGWPETQLHSKVFRRDTSIAPDRSEKYVLVNAAQAAQAGASDVLSAPTAIDAVNANIPQLTSGASGELVETLQRTLNARSSAGLGVDGDFGPATESAVNQFQAQRELPVTGVVDVATWDALRPLVEQDDPVPAPDEINAQQFTRTSALDPQAPPVVSATAWAVMDMASGEIVSGNAGLDLLPNASTTKVMTALLVIESASSNPAALQEVVTFSQRADDTPGSTAAVRVGERVAVHELLFGLLLPSGNDAAVALAEHFGVRVAAEDKATGTDALAAYDRFVAAMNTRATSLGMQRTQIATVRHRRLRLRSSV